MERASGGGTPVSRKLIGWITASGSDALLRLVLQVIGTLLLARLLAPEAFGLVALAFTLVGIAQNLVGIPFEDALAQRKGLRRVHLSSALTVSLGMAVLLLAVIWLTAPWIAQWTGAPGLAVVLPAAALVLLPLGPQAVLTALARRLHLFPLIAAANLAGQIAGVSAALAVVVLADGGLWGLVAWRVVAGVMVAIVLWAGLRCRIPLRFERARLRELSGFAGIMLADRTVENASLAAFHLLVNALFGLTVLGWLNMAMRLVEPLRGAIGAIGHNIAFSFFARAQSDPVRLGQAVRGAMEETAILTIPAFIGLAAILPVLLPLAAGPEWSLAVPLAQALALAAAMAAPMGFAHSGLAALGRPVYGLISSGIGLAVLVVALLILGPLGAAAVGLARIAMELSETAYVTGPLQRHLQLRRWALVRSIGPFVPPALIMGGLVYGMGFLADPDRPIILGAVLVGQLLLGTGLYGGLVIWWCPERALRLLDRLRGQPVQPEQTP